MRGRELPARRQAPARHRLRGAVAAVNPRLDLRLDLRLRPDRPVPRPPRLRPDRAGHGRADVRHRAARPGAGARRHPHRRPDVAGSSSRRASWWRCSSASARARGQWVHTSLLQAMVTMLDFQAARWLIDGEIPPQAGNDHPTGIPTGVFTTADGHINIAASGQTMFRRLCDGARRAGAGRRPALQDAGRPLEEPQALNAELDKVLVARSRAPSGSRRSTPPACPRARS